MLQAIRDKTTGWIAYLIIGLISVPFALWGINSYLGGGEEQPAAIIDGEQITPRQLDAAYARYRERLTSVFGGRIPEVFNDEAILKEQALTQLIDEMVLRGYIRSKGYRVGDQDLFQNIQSMPVFQQDGRFSKELYQNQLASQGYLPAMFEQELRRAQEMEQLSLAVRVSAFTTPREVERFNSLQNQERKLRTLTIENETASVQVSEQEITDYYNQQAARFMEPAKVKLDYIELNLNAIQRAVVVSEDRIQERYEQMRDQLTTAELRTASHILLTQGDKDDDKLKENIDELKLRLDQGADFATLAREFSEDPGSATDGGDLGEVERGSMVKPFEAALFELTVGQVSEPVKTQFGWHLIKLHGVSGGETKTYEQARDEIENQLKSDIAESQIYDLAENLASIAYEQPDSLAPASEQLGLSIKTTDWFTRSKGEGLAEEEKIRQIAFSEEVLNRNINSEMIELSENRMVIVHLNKHQPAVKQTLETVRESIIQTLKLNKGREFTQATGKKLLATLQSSTSSMGDVAAAQSLKVTDLGFVKRNNDIIEADLLSTAFSLQKNQDSGPVFGAISGVSGDYTIIELSAIAVPEDKKGPESLKQAVSKMTEATANYEYQSIIKSLAAQSDISRTAVKNLVQ